MAGLDKNTPTPLDITVHGATRVLEVSFSDGASFRLPFELMRIYSPSAEVQGHGPGQEPVQELVPRIRKPLSIGAPPRDLVPHPRDVSLTGGRDQITFVPSRRIRSAPVPYRRTVCPGGA